MKWEVRTMRSGTSLFNWPVFKKTVLRFWPVWGAYSAIWLVALPLQGLMMLQLEAQARPGLTDGYMRRFAQSVPEMAHMAMVLALVFGVLAAMAVCSHLYNARSANFFGSLPVRREGLFATHYLAGLAFLVVPNAVIFLLTLLIEAIGGTVLLPGLGFWLAVACGECFFFYSLAVFCGMFTGHILALPAFYGIFNVLTWALCVLASAVFHRFYYGFNGFGPWMQTLIEWLTPVMKLGSGVGGWYADGLFQTRGLDSVAAYAAAALLLAGASFLLYRARRLESAGDVVSVRCMRPVFQYGVAFCAGLTFGMATTSFLGGQEPTLMASILVWGVVGYFAARMLLDKSFRVLRYWKGAAAAAGVFTALFLVVGFDLTGFETRVPDPDQVDYVELEGANLCSLADGGDYLRAEEGGPEFVKYAVLLHQAAVDQRGTHPGGTASETNLCLTYHMKDGSTLSRWYYPVYVAPGEADREGTAAWAIRQIYGDRELYWRAYGFEEAERRMAEEGWRLREVSYENDGHDPGTDQTVYYGGAEAMALYEAVKEDFQAGRIGVRRVEDWDKYVQGRRNLNFQFSNDVNANFWIEIRVQDTASSTLAVLAQLGEGSAPAP